MHHRQTLRAVGRRSTSRTHAERPSGVPHQRVPPPSRASPRSCRVIPDQVPDLAELGLPRVVSQFTRLSSRARARHRADRHRQVHDARRDDQRDQPTRAASTSSRSRTRSSSCTERPDSPRSIQREMGTHVPNFVTDLRVGAAPGSRRDPGRRAARRRDHRARARGGGDRPPRVRHAAHPWRGADHRPHRRRALVR
mgnify:CR=1 FL=1